MSGKPKKTVRTLIASGLLVAGLGACSLPTAGVAAPAPVQQQVQPQAQPHAADPTGTQKAPKGSGMNPVSLAVPGTIPGSGGQDPYERVLADADALQPILDDFWTRELAADDLDFDAPDRFEFYSGDSNSPCGDDAVPGAQNAYYCPADGDEYVAFDIDWLASYIDAHPGDATTFLVLAHEWGHAVQDTWEEQQPGVDTWTGPAQELNADCLAGVFWEGASREGSITEEEGDADAVYTFLADGGSGTWMDPGDHGTSEQRQLAFSDGYGYGLDYCRTNY
jgi:predicted metalloprotease